MHTHALKKANNINNFSYRFVFRPNQRDRLYNQPIIVGSSLHP